MLFLWEAPKYSGNKIEPFHYQITKLQLCLENSSQDIQALKSALRGLLLGEEGQ